MHQETCITCQGTGKIIRGQDGRLIRCPSCMGRNTHRPRHPRQQPPLEINERNTAETPRTQEPNSPEQPKSPKSPTPKPRFNARSLKGLPTTLIFWAGLLTFTLILGLAADPSESPPQERAMRTQPPTSPIGNIEDAKKYMLQLVNEERRKAGVPPVKLGTNQAAQHHAEAALDSCYSSHWDQWGLKPNHRYTLAGGTGADAENVSGHDTCTGPGDGYRPLGSLSHEVADTVAGLMASRGHRQTILHPAHTVLNPGIAHDRYNINVVQQFSSNYITYQENPSIDDDGTLRFQATTQNASLDIGDYVNVQVYYDPQPHTLTRGQLYRTYSSCSGTKAAYIVSPRSSSPKGGTLEIKETTAVRRCTDPYDIPSSEKASPNPADIAQEWETIKATALQPKEITEQVHMVAATTLEKSDNGITLEANLKQTLEFHGPGIYTVIIRGKPNHMVENATLSRQAIFWQTTPPDGNPYQHTTRPNPQEN